MEVLRATQASNSTLNIIQAHTKDIRAVEVTTVDSLHTSLLISLRIRNGGSAQVAKRTFEL